MHWRKKLLQDSELYLILDTGVNTYQELFELAQEAIQSQVKIFQLRDKHGEARQTLEFAKRISEIAHKKALFIINDRVDIAVLSGADGVHLGQNDLPLADARQMLDKDLILGTSAQTEEHLLDAEQNQADYVGFGSVFKTLTKPEREPMDLQLLKRVGALSSIPLFAIGGITVDNLDLVLSTGIQRIAVTRAVSQASDRKAAIEAFQERLGAVC